MKSVFLSLRIPLDGPSRLPRLFSVYPLDLYSVTAETENSGIINRLRTPRNASHKKFQALAALFAGRTLSTSYLSVLSYGSDDEDEDDAEQLPCFYPNVYVSPKCHV